MQKALTAAATKTLGLKLARTPLEAQRMRSKLVDQAEYTAVRPVAVTKSTPLTEASEKYFGNLEARGLAAKSISTYRTGVGPFIQTCKKACVEDMIKQDMIDFIGCLRKQPLPKRKNSNPERTYSNKFSYVAPNWFFPRKSTLRSQRTATKA